MASSKDSNTATGEPANVRPSDTTNVSMTLAQPSNKPSSAYDQISPAVNRHLFKDEKLSACQVYTLLVDTFRQRMHDEYEVGEIKLGTYAGEDPVPLFRVFLDLAEKENLMPEWWSNEVQVACEALAVVEKQRANIFSKLQDGEIMERYKDELMTWKMRIMGQWTYGKGVGVNF